LDWVAGRPNGSNSALTKVSGELAGLKGGGHEDVAQVGGPMPQEEVSQNDEEKISVFVSLCIWGREGGREGGKEGGWVR